MKFNLYSISVSLVLANFAWAQEPSAPTRLNKEALQQLLTGAQIRFVSNRGNNLSWTNNPAGNMIASSVAPGGRSSTAPGKWRISDDGRYCVRLEWNSSTEEWCRLVVKEGDGYYLTRSNGEKISKLSISGK